MTDTTEQRVELLWGQKIQTRDGTRLNATLYKPRVMDKPLPVIFTLTPYIADSYHARAMYFAEHGYVFALVDVRGRGNSDGGFVPCRHDAADGHDVAEWLATQPFCDGKVAMWGGSHGGFDQWATLSQFPPHLATIVPAAAAYPGVDFPFWRNIAFSFEVQWQTFVSGRVSNANLFNEQSYWIGVFRDYYLNHHAFKDLDQIAGNPNPHFQADLRHPAPDDHWDSLAPTDAQFAAFDLPILSITGHYDDNQPGAMHFYRQHLQRATPEAQDKHYLLIGPWDHAGTRTPQPEFGGLAFGAAALVDLNKLHQDWYDWTMKDGPKPEFLQKRVTYYVTGSEEWKRADSLDAIPAERRKLYLASINGWANDVFQSGMMLAAPTTEHDQIMSDSYTYDPMDTRPAELEREDIQKDYIVSQRYALNLYGNGLVYHSEPLAEATEIVGYVKFEAWISMDAPDTDFMVTLAEILPDGRHILLTQDMLRARYRESLRREALVEAGEINRYVFDGFYWFARRLAQGSRLRLILRCPNSIYIQKNYNGGGVVAEETGADARVAHVTLHHDSEHPTFLEIPVAKG